jgi:hypothetical protein
MKSTPLCIKGLEGGQHHTSFDKQPSAHQKNQSLLLIQRTPKSAPPLRDSFSQEFLVQNKDEIREFLDITGIFPQITAPHKKNSTVIQPQKALLRRKLYILQIS